MIRGINKKIDKVLHPDGKPCQLVTETLSPEKNYQSRYTSGKTGIAPFCVHT